MLAVLRSGPRCSDARSRRARFVLAVLLSAVALLSQVGCASYFLAARLVKAPNQQMPAMTKYVANWREAQQHWSSRMFRVAASGEGPELAVAVIDPAAYGLEYRIEVKEEAGKGHVEMEFKIAQPLHQAPPLPVRGTIIGLHGIFVYKESLVPWALRLAEEGFRVILVDLPGHGDSTGDRISFGRWERESLRRLLDALEQRDEIVGGVGVLGISYGAAIGLQWAALDSRIQTVVALEPYADASRAVVGVARGQFGKSAGRFSDETFARALWRAQRLGGFRWDDVDVAEYVRALAVPVLFVHGARDDWVTPDHSETLRAAANADSELLILPNDNHVTLPLRVNELGAVVADWFLEKLVREADGLQQSG